VTGDPKGVIHTHGSVVSTVESIKEFLHHNKVGLSCEDVYYSFLPLAHIFDRCVCLSTPAGCVGGRGGSGCVNNESGSKEGGSRPQGLFQGLR